MINSKISAKLLVVLPVVIMMVILSGCAGKAPVETDEVITNLRDSFNEENIDKYSDHFADGMYAGGNTDGNYLGMIREMRRENGDWISEKYKGIKDGNNYRWEVKFQYVKMEMTIIFNDRYRISQLYYKAL